MSADAVVAGRLEIPVESNTKGFKERLKKAIDKESQGVDAEVGVDVTPKGLKKRLEAVVDEASKGVDAKVGVKIKTKDLKAKLEAAVKAAGPVTVDADLKKFSATVKQHLDQLAKEKVTVAVTADEKGLTGLLARMRAKIKAANLNVPVSAGGGAGGGGRGGKSGGFELPDWLKPKGGARSSFLPIGILGLASVIQPAIAAIVGSLGGLVAMAGSAAASLNVLGGAGGVLGALGLSFAAVTISVKELMAGKLEDLPKSLRGMRKEVDNAGESWAKLREGIAVSFWDQLDGQIRKTSKVLFPLLADGLKGVGRELGETGKQTAKWMRSPMFQKQAGSIFYTARTVTDGLGRAFLGIAKGMVNITQAAGPMLGKFGDVLRDFGDWAAGIGNTAKEQRELGKAFEYGWQKAAQLWDMTKNLGASLKAMFGAGRESGDRLLGSLQGVIREWRTWAESTEGQERIKKWFENVEPIARSAGRLIVDLGKAIGRLAEDGTTAGLLEKIRTELLPSLETFLRNLGTTLGPAVITFVTNVLEVLTQMSAAGSPLGQGLDVINKLISGLADIFQANPELAKNVGILLGALLGFRALTFFTSIIPGLAGLTNFIKGGGKAAWLGAAGGIALFSGALSGLPGPLQGAVAALSTLLTLVPSFRNFGTAGRGFGDFGAHVQLLGQAFKEKKGDVSGFAGALRGLSGSIGYGAGAVGGGVKGALGGLMGLLGGPWGLALVGASAAIGAFAQAQANAKADVEALMSTVDKQTGSFTEASKAQVNQKLGFDVNSDDLALLDRLGADVSKGADSVLGDQATFDAYIKNLQAISHEQSRADGVQGASKAAEGYISSLNHQRDAAAGVREQLAGMNLLTGESGTKAAGAAPGVQTLGDKLRAMAPTATEVADALERLAGITLSSREANRRAAESADALDAALKKNGKTHNDNTEKGRANNAALDAYAQAQVAATKAAAEGGAPVKALTDKLEKARAKFVASAIAANYSETEANALATQMGLTGEAAEGMAAKVAKIKGKTVVVKVTDQASAVAAAAQRAIDSVTGKTVTITSVFQTSGFYASLRAAQAVRNASVYFGEADGGIIRQFADGGVQRAIGRKVRAFANGAERHIAQIARGGEYRVWAEDETGGEAYIPLAKSKRARSMDILAQVADEFGMALTPALSGAASAAGTAYASASRASYTDRAVPGGDQSVTFQEGAITVNNPAPEPVSKSVPDVLRGVGSFGLFGED